MKGNIPTNGEMAPNTVKQNEVAKSCFDLSYKTCSALIASDSYDLSKFKF